MSHVAQIELEIKDLDALETAARSLGLTLQRGQQQFRYYAGQLQTCEHAITVPGTDYEIGIRRNHPGFTYRLECDFFCDTLSKAIGENGAKLKQAYAAEVSAKHYQSQGYRVTRHVTADGRLILKASK